MSGEPTASYGRQVVAGSERSFGLVFACVFVLIGLVPWLLGYGLRNWALVVAAIFLIAAYLFPAALGPLNRLWFKFGLLLHHIINPIIMALIFFGAVLPTALVVRALGKNLLYLKRDPTAKSYWITARPPRTRSRIHDTSILGSQADVVSC